MLKKPEKPTIIGLVLVVQILKSKGELLNLVFNESFEVSRQSLTLLESIDNIPNEIRENTIKRVQKKIENLNDEIDFFDDVLAVLDDNED